MRGRLARARLTRRARLRVARLAVAAGVLGLGLVALPGHASTDACPVAVKHFADGWDRISLPSGFVTSQHAIVDYALDTGTTDHLIATNGDDIVASSDGGCTWTTASLPAASPVPALPGDNSGAIRRVITHVRISPYRGVSWASGVTNVEVDNSPVTQPVVLVSTDGGQSFASATNGLPATARVIDLVPLPGSQSAYVLLRQLAGTGQDIYSIYETTDAGANWAQVFGMQPAFEDFTLGLTGSGIELWAWTEGTLYRSVNNQPFAPVPAISGRVRTVDVSPDLISVFFVEGGSRMVSTNDGSTWQRVKAPLNVQSATHGPLPGLIAVSGAQPNVEVDPPTSMHRAPIDVSPQEHAVDNLQMSMGIESYGFLLYGATSEDIFRFKVPASFVYLPPPPPAEPPATVHVTARVPVLRAPELSPNIATVTLAPYQRRDIPYRLLLPPAPTPLDVYFMTDSTGSMADTIGSVQDSIQQIVDALTATGTDVHFGVADFRDYPMEDDLVLSGDYAYRRDRAIGPVDEAFAQALQSIQACCGTQDGEDSGLEAIYQAATGAGRQVLTDPTGNSNILPGQGADFRRGAVKVIVVAADAYFRHPETNPGWPGPSLATDEATLARLGIHLVGLDVDTGSGQDPGPDMRALALASHTVAGPAGVDCNGDGTPDLRPGDPLVCPYASNTHASIAPAFLGLLDSLRDLKTVSLGVQGPRDVVRPLGATSFPRVNVKAVNTLGVPLEFGCDPPRFGTTTTIRVVAAVAKREVASLPVAVKCEAPLPAPPVQPLLALPPLAAIAVLPPAPPAQPVQPNPNPNPQPQTQPNAGMASQEDDVQQLAFAEDGLIPDEPGMAMSALRPQSSVGPGSDSGDATYVLGAGVLLAFGAGCRLRMSRRLSWERNPR